MSRIEHITSNKTTVRLCRTVIGVIVFCALFAEWICNDQALITTYQGHWHITAYTFNNTNEGTPVLNAPIPYAAHTQDARCVHALSPAQASKYKHLLGTDELGHDVLTQLVYGCRTALIVGLLAVIVACLIGVLIGLLAGYWGNNYLRAPAHNLTAWVVSLPFIWFYSWNIRACFIADTFSISFIQGVEQVILSLIIAVGIVIVLQLCMKLLFRLLGIKKLMAIPVDTLLSRGIDVFMSLPLFYVILFVLSMVYRVSIIHIAVIIGCTSWVAYARLMRAEVLRLRTAPFIDAARTAGGSTRHIISRHIIPNTLSPIIVAAGFGVANAILAESTFSYLGLLPADTVSWGAVLAESRATPEAWWLAVFPGIMLTVMLLCLYSLGNAYKNAHTRRVAVLQ